MLGQKVKTLIELIAQTVDNGLNSLRLSPGEKNLQFQIQRLRYHFIYS